jgi:hypothetical protein
MAFTKIAGYAGLAVDAAAASRFTGLSAAGRAASTPIASSVIQVGKAALIAIPVAQTASAYTSAETDIEKGAVIGSAGIMLYGFAMGANAVKSPTELPTQEQAKVAIKNFMSGSDKQLPMPEGYVPQNEYLGKEFFSGKYALPPLESARMTVSAGILSLGVPAGERAAYRAVPEIFRAFRFTEPLPGGSVENPAGTGLKAPDLAAIKEIGPDRAPAVEAALGEVHHVIKGSSVVEAQKTNLGVPTRVPKDLDVIADKTQLEDALRRHGETTQGMDIKDFEKGYPVIPGVTQPSTGAPQPGEVAYTGWAGVVKGIIGEPIRETQGMKLPYAGEILQGGKNYEGGLNMEALNVQGARKAQAVMQDLMSPEMKKFTNAAEGQDVARPADERYRLEKDMFDLQAIARDLKGAEQLRAGKPVDVSAGNTPELAILEKTTFEVSSVGSHVRSSKTGQQIREQFEADILGNKVEPYTYEPPRVGSNKPSAIGVAGEYAGIVGASSIPSASSKMFASPSVSASPAPEITSMSSVSTSDVSTSLSSGFSSSSSSGSSSGSGSSSIIDTSSYSSSGFDFSSMSIPTLSSSMSSASTSISSYMSPSYGSRSSGSSGSSRSSGSSGSSGGIRIETPWFPTPFSPVSAGGQGGQKRKAFKFRDQLEGIKYGFKNISATLVSGPMKGKKNQMNSLATQLKTPITGRPTKAQRNDLFGSKTSFNMPLGNAPKNAPKKAAAAKAPSFKLKKGKNPFK